MPEDSTALALGIAQFLAQFEGARLLTSRDLAEYNHSFRSGWEIPNVCADRGRNLRLLLSASNPPISVRVAAFPAPTVLAWPHLEGRGLLCLPTLETVSISGTLDAIPHLIEAARTLVDVSTAGQNVQDFEDEFTSYWTQWDRTKVTLNLICEPRGPSRDLMASGGTDILFAAEDEVTLRAWLANRFSESTASKATCARASLIWLPRALRPSEYPATVAALRTSLNENPMAIAVLEAALLRPAMEPRLIVLGMPTRRGIAFAGLSIQKPVGLANGFRKCPPKSETLKRYNAAQILGAKVTRFDHEWIHGRGHNPEAAVLRNKKAAVIGVGAVGSSVADLLAKAGVGKMLLYDGEMMESANSSRHLLGVPAVGIAKTKAVAEDISRRLPHLMITAYGAFTNTPTIIDAVQSADVIISMTGDWPTEFRLDAIWHAIPAFPPIIYGWAEPHATAGHALALNSRERCLHCALNDQGGARIAVTAWAQRTTSDIPACGGTFQPYGAAELAHTHALIANLAIDVLLNRTAAITHRAWIGTQDHVQRAGGTWEPRWISTYGDPALGGKLVEVPLDSCDKCKALQ